MGLFGKKKSSRSAAVDPTQQRTSSYAPPTDVVSSPTEVEAVVSNDGDIPDDAVMVASVPRNGSNDSKKKSLHAVEDMEGGVDDDMSKILKKPSMIEQASFLIKAALSGNKLTNTLDTDYNGMDDSKPKSSKKSQVMDRVTASFAGVLAFWFSLSKVAQVALLAGAGIGAVTVTAVMAAGGRSPAFPAHINVAFVGNSYLYANDLPRFVENIGNGHVTQDSVIHNAAGILQVIMTGNGMWNKWATKTAMSNGVKFETYRNTTEYLYDMGACSVPQLLTGHDQTITMGNKYGGYVDDGQNPCFQQDAYREYQESTDLKHKWDFVVISDKSKAMAFDETREEALMAFNYTYGPLLKKEHITPVIVQPHAYSSDGVSSISTDDLSTFTALIMEGAQIYRKYLNKRIGLFNHAHIAPVGNAYLAVYEESPDDLWPKLFLDDAVHPSAYGTFVYGCVIYATMTGYMPKYKNVVVDDMENSALFANARRLQSTNSKAGFPTKDEAAILYKIAKKVAIRGYEPKLLKGFKIEEGAADFLESNSNSVYQGSYAGVQSYAQNTNYDGYNQNNQYNGYQNNAVNYGNNYQQNYDYGNNYQQNYDNGEDAGNNGEDNGNYNNANYNNNANGNYNANYNNDANGNYDANYNNDANENNANENNANYNNGNANGNDDNNGQYGGGNQNKMQYYYQELTDDSN